MGLPEWASSREDGTGTRRTVCSVQKERDAVCFGDSRKLGDLVVGKHVPGRVGRPGGADGGDVRGDFEPLEVDSVFEFMGPDFLDRGLNGLEQGTIDTLVCVADVFRDERKQDLLPRAIRPRLPAGSPFPPRHYLRYRG